MRVSDGKEPEQWWEANGDAVTKGRQRYRWPPNADPAASLRRRAQLASECTNCARQTGTLSKDLGIEIVAWGFNEATASVDAIDAVLFEDTLQEALALSAEGRVSEAATTVVSLPRIGISTATKLLAFPSGGIRVIYDHRTAKALAGLTVQDQKIPIPPSRSDRGTSSHPPTLCRGYGLYSVAIDRLLAQATSDPTARDVLRTRDDIEMGLFMVGGQK